MIHYLSSKIWFPDTSLADQGGLLAAGGDLSPERLIAAYSQGIFPWYDERTPILWWSPDPRLILVPDEVRVSRRLERTLRSGKFEVSFDRDFAAVIRSCAGVFREGQPGTWILPEIIQAYTKLHEMGYAHSVETRQDGRLVGGLYGISLGRAFFGESMFHLVSDASKVAFVQLCRYVGERGFTLIDCQQVTAHMQRFGARPVAREEFMRRLVAALI